MLEAIVAADSTNNTNNQIFIIALPNLFFISSIFLNNGTEHKNAAMTVITSVVSI